MTREEAIYSAGYIEGACLLLWMMPDDKISADAVAALEQMAHGIGEYLMSGGSEEKAPQR